MLSIRSTFARLSLTAAALMLTTPAPGATDKCLSGASTVGDAGAIAAVRLRVEQGCPCVSFDGSSSAKKHGSYVKCAKAIILDASDGSPLPGGIALRQECRSTVIKMQARSACGYTAAQNKRPCCQVVTASGKTSGSVKAVTKCVDSPKATRHACPAHRFAADACSNDLTNSCTTPCGFGPCAPVDQTTIVAPASAATSHTPDGTLTVTNPKLVAQFGSTPNLDNVVYTRYRTTLYGGALPAQPDAILVLVPGFEGGAASFKLLAENLVSRALRNGQVIEVWAFDRRSHQLEDRAGLDIAEGLLDPQVALDWFYGTELGLPLSAPLAAGPNRRAVFYDTQADVPFMAEWTGLLFSRDIDDVVQAARAVARNQNVFLGGHSAGTGFTARYAATDFDLGPGVDPGYSHVRGLVLLEGPGGSTGGTPLTSDSLDRMIAKADGGLYGAVAAGAPRCVDGTTPCTIATEAVDCVGQVPPVCTPSTPAYAIVPGLLNARLLASVEVPGIQGMTDPDGGQIILQVDQGSPGNNAIAKVTDLNNLALITPASTVEAGVGSFIDDDGVVAGLAFFVATSVGEAGPVVGGLTTWHDYNEGPFSPTHVPNNGPAPTTLPGAVWGQEVEPTRFDRLMTTFFAGGTNFTDWYYPSAGLGVTSGGGLCVTGTCVAGNVGASCANDGQCSQAINLDSTALSVGRGRPDIENLTQAASINVPVIAFGATNGLVPVPGRMVPFANSIGTCTAPSCSGAPRVVNDSSPNGAFPTFGDVAGGFEVFMSEGYSHVDIVTAEDDATNHVIDPLASFLLRNSQ